MNLSTLSLRRPVFVTCIVILMLLAGYKAFKSVSISLNPEINVPNFVITTEYPGAGPKEVESVITKPLEDEFISLEGIKKIKSTSQDSMSIIEAQFEIGVNSDSIEQKIRDRISVGGQRFPNAVKKSIIEKYDPSAEPVLWVSVSSSKMNVTQLTTWVEKDLKAQLSQVKKVGKIDIYGGRKREIHVQLDPKKLDYYKIPLIQVSEQLSKSGENIPGGSIQRAGKELNVRNLGEFSSFNSIETRLISFSGGEAPVRVKDLGNVTEGASKETSRAYSGKKAAIVVSIRRQAGANIIEVTDSLKEKLVEMSTSMKAQGLDVELEVGTDGSKEVRDNIWDVQESIFFGIILTVIVVFYFLGSFKSTLITGLALPNSLLGAFILIYLFGFTMNVMSLLALSLAVGLLVDDAIVVRENIFKHLEEGKSPLRAAFDGVREVRMAVIATTAAILAVFGPLGFMPGELGQWFKEFGFVVSFAMLISLFDALTIAPMLSAYWGGTHEQNQTKKNGFLQKLTSPIMKSVKAFDKFQTFLEKIYRNILSWIVNRPVKTLVMGIVTCILLFGIAGMLPATFIPQGEVSQFSVTLEIPPGNVLDQTDKVTKDFRDEVEKVNGIKSIVTIVGDSQGQVNNATLNVLLKSPKERQLKSTEIADKVREIADKNIAKYPGTEIRVNLMGAGFGSPYELTLLGNSNDEVKKYSNLMLERLRKEKFLIEVQSNSKVGKPELIMKIDSNKAQRLGISESLVGTEIRGRIEGIESARYREDGREYDIRVRIKDGAKNFVEKLDQVMVPNLNMLPVKLSEFSNLTEVEGDNKLQRSSRAAAIKISANLAPGVGIAEAVQKSDAILKELKLPLSIQPIYEGEAQSFDETGDAMGTVFIAGIILIYLVLASLYESFFIPVLVMSALPLAIVGSFASLLIAGQGFDLYSVIGMLLLMGVATKNSILMVDTVMESLKEHSDMSFSELIISSSVRRLRPILMTSLALIAGMIPICIGLNEASAQRKSLGTAVIGGTISSTALTLILVPAILVLVKKRLEKTAKTSSERTHAVDALEMSASQSVKTLS